MDKTGAVIHRPNLDRLFGSSALKQDATHVIFVYREWALEIKKTIINKEACSSYYINRLIIGKHRFGYNAIEIAVGFVPYISYFVPLQQIRDNNLLHSYDPSAVFPKIKDFAEKTN
jgi:replicative DNA helicase